MPSRKTNNRRRGAVQRGPARPRPQTPPREQAAPDGTGGPATPNRPAVQMQLGSSTTTKPRPAPTPGPSAAPTAARRIQAQRRTARTRPSRGIQIGDENPAIPLDKVPYFSSDLIRLGITAAIMIILLIIGAKLVVPHLTG